MEGADAHAVFGFGVKRITGKNSGVDPHVPDRGKIAPGDLLSGAGRLQTGPGGETLGHDLQQSLGHEPSYIVQIGGISGHGEGRRHAAICRTGHPVDKDDRGPVRDEIVGGNGDIRYRHLLIRLLRCS